MGLETDLGEQSEPFPDREKIRDIDRSDSSSHLSAAGSSRDREKTIGELIRERRKPNGSSQRALAELAGVGPRAVWDLEQDKKTLRMDVANAVLAVFGKRLGIVDAPRPEVEP